MDIVAHLLVYTFLACIVFAIGYIIIKFIGLGLVIGLHILSGILKLMILPIKFIGSSVLYIVLFNSYQRSYKIGCFSDYLDQFPNTITNFAELAEDFVNGDFSVINRYKHKYDPNLPQIGGGGGGKKSKKNKSKKEYNSKSRDDYKNDYEPSSNSSSNSSSSKSNHHIQNNDRAIESELNRMYSRYMQIYRDNKLNLQQKNKLQYGIDERFSNLNRNNLNLDKRINEATAIAYYLEANELIKFRDEKVMYPNVMKNI